MPKSSRELRDSRHEARVGRLSFVRFGSLCCRHKKNESKCGRHAGQQRPAQKPAKSERAQQQRG
jgi:hypothetical protein